MKKYFGFRSFDEAEEKVYSLLSFDHVERTTYKDSDKKIREAIYRSDLDEVAYVYDQRENRYALALFTPEEWERYTYVFRNLQPKMLFIPLSLNANFVKPSKPVSLDEALSATGDKIIGDFFSTEYEGRDLNFYSTDQPTSEEELRKYTRETAFDVYEPDEDELEEFPDAKRTIELVCNPPVYLLADVTGKEILDVKGYEKALSSLLDAKFSKEEKEAIRSNFIFYQGERLINFALYEFLRTESYDRLKEILKSYSKFGLPDDWEENIPYLWESRSDEEGSRRITAEERILALYLCKDASDLIGGYTYREIAERTGTPIETIIKCSKMKIW